MSIWTSPESTFLNNVSLSINMVLYISAAVLTTNSCFVSSFINSFSVFFMSLPRVPIITCAIVTVYPSLLSLASKASCQYCENLSLRFVSTFCCMRHAMSQIQICFSSFVSCIKSGVLLSRLFIS